MQLKPCPICTEPPLSGNPDDYQTCEACDTAIHQTVAQQLPTTAEEHERDLREAALAEIERINDLVKNWNH